jgi:hypothetical protein
LGWQLVVEIALGHCGCHTQADLVARAVDGRIRGHIALDGETYARARITRTASGARVQVV